MLDVHVGATVGARPEPYLARAQAPRSRALEQRDQRTAHTGPRPLGIVVAPDDHEGVAGPAPRGERAEDGPVGDGDDAELPDGAGLVAAESEGALPEGIVAPGGRAQPVRCAAHSGGPEQLLPCGYAAGRIGQANDAQEVERVAVEHELEATTAPRAVRAQAAQPACELAIVKEVLARDATAHRRRALAEMQVADDDETVG